MKRQTPAGSQRYKMKRQTPAGSQRYKNEKTNAGWKPSATKCEAKKRDGLKPAPRNVWEESATTGERSTD
jgi:hypothetical protein